MINRILGCALCLILSSAALGQTCGVPGQKLQGTNAETGNPTSVEIDFAPNCLGMITNLNLEIYNANASAQTIGVYAKTGIAGGACNGTLFWQNVYFVPAGSVSKPSTLNVDLSDLNAANGFTTNNASGEGICVEFGSSASNVTEVINASVEVLNQNGQRVQGTRAE